MEKSSAQPLQIDAPIIERFRQANRLFRARLVPAAMAAVERELLLDVGARQRLLGPAAEMRLALLDDAAVIERRTDVAGELVRIAILRVDAVAHLAGEREHVRRSM